jgi:hypothetical protein
MKKLIFTTIIGLTIINLFAQEKKDLSISFASGIFNSPFYPNAKARPFYNFDFSYNIEKHHAIATTFIAGKHFYYDNKRSNNAVPLDVPGYEKNRNAIADYVIFSVLYKYKVYNNDKFSINTGAGAGIMTQVMEFPYTEGNSTDFRQSSSSGVVFPVRLEIDYQLSKNFQCGIIGGIFFPPDLPNVYYAGPRLTYILK